MKDDEAIAVTVRYLDAQERRLLAFNDPFSVRANWTCRIPELGVQMSMSLAEWVAGLRELAGDIAASIFHMFNWEDVGPQTYRKVIDKLLDRRR